MTALWTAGGRCVGAATDRARSRARSTLLATGGASALWKRTTNPPGAVGEGIAAAYRVGAAVADLEFTQFHPTTLVDSTLLLSEALRGEGAVLLDEDGRRFTDELAPRDVVAREIAARGTALLDLRSIDRGRFPTLMGSLLDRGYDPAASPIPVAPAAHYTVGGIITDLDGRSEVPGLYAAGECAATGVHGANRLASNSLLECLVFGRRAAHAALDDPAADAAAHATRPSAVEPRHGAAAEHTLGRLRTRPGCGRARAAPGRAAPPRPADRRERAPPRGEPRLPLPRRLPRDQRGVRAARRAAPRIRADPGDMAVATDTLERVAFMALAEDVGEGDVTTEATVDADATGSADLVVKEAGVVCGLDVAEAVFRAVDPELRFERLVDEGARRGRRHRRRPRRWPRARDPHRRAHGAELPRPSLRDRDPDPSLRRRGRRHRRRDPRHAQDDPGPARAREARGRAAAAGATTASGSTTACSSRTTTSAPRARSRTAVERLRGATPLPVEVECDTLEQVSEALAAGADAILLDNMAPDRLRAAVGARRRPGAPRGLRRHHARQRTRRRRDRGRRDLGRRAHPLRPIPRRLTGAR